MNPLIRDAVMRRGDKSPLEQFKPPLSFVNSVATLASPERTKSATIRIDGQITDRHLEVVRDGLEAAEFNEVFVGISSKGGDFFSAVNIYNLLRSSDRKITTIAGGVCCSAGAVILLAGERILATKSAILMWHMPEAANIPSSNVTKLERYISTLRACEESLIATLQTRTGWSRQRTKDFLAEERFLSADEARRLYLIDDIC